MVLFFTKLSGPRKKGVASCDVPLACLSVLGLSPFLRALLHVSVGLSRVHIALGKCTPVPFLTAGKEGVGGAVLDGIG